MNPPYWTRQTATAPAYPDIAWSRPERKASAGKLLIIGGNAHGFAAVGQAYSQALAAGIGAARAALPNVLQKTVGPVLDDGEFFASNPSGGFAKLALPELLATAAWADGVLLAGDFGRNAETGIVIERLFSSYSGPLSVTKDGLDFLLPQADKLLARPDTLLVLNGGQLQRLAIQAGFSQPFTSGDDLVSIVTRLHTFSSNWPQPVLLTLQAGSLLVAHAGRISSTPSVQSQDIWQLEAAARGAVYWLQHPAKPFEAVTASLVS